MDQGSDKVQQDIENTRAAITEKLKLLEERARESVEDAKTAVKQSVDVHHQVAQHPWEMVGISVLVGYMLGRATSGRSPSSLDGQRILMLDTPVVMTTYSATQKPDMQDASSRSETQGLELSGGVLERYKDALTIIKGVAVEATVSVARDLIKQAVLTLTSHVKKTSNASFK